MKEYFELGQILKPQGLKGEVKVALFTDDPARIDSLEYVCFKTNGAYEKIGVKKGRLDGKGGIYLSLEGFDDRTSAESLRGRYFYIDREHAASLPDGSYYVEDLIGSAVKDSKGATLGVLKDILQNGCTDVYCVDSDDPFMFPAVADVFIERDIEKGIIVLNETRLSEIAVYGF